MSLDKLQLLMYREMHTLVLDSFGQKLRDRSHDVDLNRIVSCNAYDANSYLYIVLKRTVKDTENR